MSKIKKIQRQNKLIYKDTLHQGGIYPCKSCEIIDIAADPADGAGGEPIVRILCDPVFAVLQALGTKKVVPLYVNECNGADPSSAAKSGAIDKEFDLMRCTNFYNTIRDDFYPLSYNQALYTSEVTAFKDHKNGEIIPPYRIAVLSLMSPNSPSVLAVSGDNGVITRYVNAKERGNMEDRVNFIFGVARKYGHKAIVINDFGCAQGNPPHEVAEIFKKAIASYRPRYVFFAITGSERKKNIELFYRIVRR